MEQNVGMDEIELPTVKGFYHSILRFGYILAEAHIEENIKKYGLPQEDFVNLPLSLVASK